MPPWIGLRALQNEFGDNQKSRVSDNNWFDT